MMHPKMLARLTALFPQACTIQRAQETVNADGEVQKAWTNFAGHIDIPCSVAPDRIQGGEIQASNRTYAEGVFIIALQGYYPGITAAMRAVVGGTPYDIVLPLQSSHGLNTRLKCRVVG